ncbi:MAG TPA: hypothetical protein VH025_10120 [Solirubrobacteraceae bacterium]|nr:hypothetical protein [Solirubrobacteraceae bacterium]
MKKQMLATALTVAAVSALASGVAVSTASKSAAKHATTRHSTQAGAGAPPGGGPGGGPGGMGTGMRGSVHAEGVVLNKAGTAFVTQTTDSGTVKSVDAAGSTITLVEGTQNVTYKTETLAISSAATVQRDGKTATLSDLVAGDRVTVSSSSDGTEVFASDSSYRPAGHPGGPPPAQGAPSGSASTGSGSTGSTSG